jgi:hypothetical protein
VYISRHIIFYETTFPAATFFSDTRPTRDDLVGFASSTSPSISLFPPDFYIPATDFAPTADTSHSPLVNTPSPTSTPILTDTHSNHPEIHPPDTQLHQIFQDSPPHPPTTFQQPLQSTSQPHQPLHDRPRILTRSQTRSSQHFFFFFDDFHLYYSTKHSLKAISSISLPAEPKTFKQVVVSPFWFHAMQPEFLALISNHT